MERICWPAAKGIKKDQFGTVTWRKCSVHGLEFPTPMTCPACDRDIITKIRNGELHVYKPEDSDK